MKQEQMQDKAKALFPDEQQYRMCNEMVQFWINYTHDNPELMLGTHLRAFAVCSALAMRLCDLKDDEYPDAMNTFNELVKQVFDNAEENIKAATLQ